MQSPDEIPLDTLLGEIRRCTLCAAELPLGPRPVLQAGREARILVVGQAPGTRACAAPGCLSTIPTATACAKWLGVDRDTFYDPARIAVVPMAFLLSGARHVGRSAAASALRADLAIPAAGAAATHSGGPWCTTQAQYAVAWHLPDARGSLTGIVPRTGIHLPATVPMPHPSPRNNLWLRRGLVRPRWFPGCGCAWQNCLNVTDPRET
ncbi:MAG: uracil-DNA glycosylase family protein [Pseudomonadales bacterium]